MELKKKIEKSESNINQLEKLLDELHDTKIKLFKAKVEKEYNIQLEKQERNEQYQSINESYGLASDFNYAYAQNQSLALTNNRRY